MNTFFESYPLIASFFTYNKLINLIVGITGISLSLTIGLLLKKSLLKLRKNSGHAALFITLAAHIIKSVCVCAGILFFMKALGINIGSIIKTIAFFGLGVSFIFKDLLADITAGFFIVAYKNLSLGTKLTITTDKTTYSGKIKSIDLRYIALENDNETVLIPNSFFFKFPLAILKNQS